MGEPGGGHTPSFPTEYIGWRRRTRGSETSQYPQEKKSREIPSVAASERGRAQTREHACGGCGAPMWDVKRIEERYGKAGQRR